MFYKLSPWALGATLLQLLALPAPGQELPDYNTTVAWIQSKVPMIGRDDGKGNETAYSDLSMDACVLTVTITSRERYRSDDVYTKKAYLHDVKSIRPEFEETSFSLLTNHSNDVKQTSDGRTTSTGYIRFVVDKADVDNSDLSSRLIKAFQHAIDLCKPAPASNEPF